MKRTREFPGWNWAGHALGNPDFAFTKKSYDQNINSVFIRFHQDKASEVIGIQPYIEKFRITSQDAGNQTYPSSGLFMRTWNDPIQSKMIWDAFNFSKNKLRGLPEEFSDSYRLSVGPMVVATNIRMARNEDISRINTTNFLHDIPNTFDCIHMEAVTRT